MTLGPIRHRLGVDDTEYANIDALARRDGSSSIEACGTSGPAIRSRHKARVGCEVVHYDQGQFTGVTGLVELIRIAPAKGIIAHSMGARNGGAAQPEFFAMTTLRQARDQRERGRCFGDDVLMGLVEKGDQRPGGARLAGCELGERSQCAVGASYQFGAGNGEAVIVESCRGQQRPVVSATPVSQLTVG